MSYKKQTFSKGQVLTADALNTMSEGIASKCGIADVNELPKAGWVGTAVPNSGTLSAFYANFNLSDDEITELLSKLTYTEISADGETVNMYVAFCGGSGSEVFDITVIKMPDVENGFGIASYTTGLIIWFSKTYAETQNLEPGWQDGTNSETLYDTPVPLNNTFTLIDQVFEVGTQNELLSSLFSTTPFEYIENIDDNSIYRTKKLDSISPYGYVEGVLQNLEGITPYNIIICNEFPSEGEDFTMGILSNDAKVYYNTELNECYVYVSDLIAQQTGGALQKGFVSLEEFMVVSGETVVTEYVDSLDEIPEYEEGMSSDTTMYLLKNYTCQYFIYNANEKKWSTLIDSNNIKDFIPEKHLYEWSVRIRDDNSGANTDIWFTYLTDTSLPTLESVRDILYYIAEKSVNYISRYFDIQAHGKYNGDIIHNIMIDMLDVGSYNFYVRVIKEGTDTDRMLDNDFNNLYPELYCRKIY